MSLDDAVRTALELEIASRDAAMPSTETNALRTASRPVNLNAVLEANPAAMKEVIGALQDLTAARQTDSTSYSSRRRNSRFSARRGRGSRLSEVICWKCGQPDYVQAVCTNTSQQQYACFNIAVTRHQHQ